MLVSLSIISAVLAVTSAYGGAEYSVTVYEGPTECEDSEKVAAGDYLTIHYTGTIDESSDTGEKGQKFDSSRDRNAPFKFEIGIGRVIKGWDEGLIGLCKGAKATLILPPDYGYGAQGAGGDIPGGATLNFDVEVEQIDDSAPDGPPQPDIIPQRNFFVMIDTNGDRRLDKDELAAYVKTNFPEDVDSIAESEELLESEDVDKDGFISWDEFSGPKGGAPTRDAPKGDDLTRNATTGDEL